MSHGWENNLCGCFSAPGCLGWCCPCILYGRTSYRHSHPNDDKLQDYSCCNGDCVAYGALLALVGIGAAILQCVRRPNIREHLGIQGNGCKDCMVGCCCHCCALIQEDRELKDFQEHKGVYAALQPGKHDGMMYAPPPPPQQQQQHGMPQHPGMAHHAV